MQIQIKTQAAVPAASSNACRVCGRPLTDPISVALGIGPQCRVTQKNQTMQEKTLHLFGHRANYTWSKDGDIIAIVDLDNGLGPSVTNDMENVLLDIAMELGHGLRGYRILYRDSQGTWDGVHLLPNGKPRFYSINERNYQKAKAKIS
jgi:hypothetical protein